MKCSEGWGIAQGVEAVLIRQDGGTVLIRRDEGLGGISSQPGSGHG